MKFRIHFTINEISDYFDIEGDSINEIADLVKQEQIKRGLNNIENNMWSEELTN